MWVELLLALIVEGYREFTEWWQTRSWPRPREASAHGFEARSDRSRVDLTPGTRSSTLEGRAAAILDRHASKHVGVGVGVCWQGEIWTFARGRVGAERPEPLGPETLFEIGSITKVFTATVLADMVEDGLVALDDPCGVICPTALRSPSADGRSRSPISPRRRAGFPDSRRD